MGEKEGEMTNAQIWFVLVSLGVIMFAAGFLCGLFVRLLPMLP